VAANDSACSMCGSPVVAVGPEASVASSSKTSANRVIAVVAIFLIVGLLFALLWMRRGKQTPRIVEIDQVVDVNALRAKAETGDAKAQNDLGQVYAKGDVLKQSYAEAAQWYLKAAEQGNPAAQGALGELYEAGQSVPHDDAEAAKWYAKAAEQGFARAQYNLAVLYLMGRGVPRNMEEAVKWYRKAAERGNALAQFNMGMRYLEGNAVGPDTIEAYKWFTLAAAQGIPDAARARDELKGRMSRKEIAEAKRRTTAFVPQVAAKASQ
jgi:hypothetical protein